MFCPPGFKKISLVDTQTLLCSPGCPANNTNCLYLVAVCICINPILYQRQEDGKYVCESAYFSKTLSFGKEKTNE
jgi:hypothetical protein